jgi:hypothetical protein
MAESTLSLKFSTIREAIAHYLGYKRLATVAAGLTTDELADVDAYHNEGMRDFLGAFPWSFLSPVVSVTLWKTATGSIKDIATVTITTAAAEFFATMVGRKITFDTSGTEYDISSYTSSTVLVLTADASGETAATGTMSGQPAAGSTLTATADVFVAADVTDAVTVTFTASSNSYTIWSRISATEVVLSGDATGEASGDTFTIDRASAVTATMSGVPVAASLCTATAAVFASGLIDKYLEFDTSGTAYLINSYLDTTNVSVVGDATGEASGDTLTVWDTFTITANGLYRMPDAFGGIVGPITFENNEGSYSPIELVSERQVAELLQRSTSAARPTLAAQRPVSGTSATAGQRWDLLVYRIPDDDYTAYFREILLVDQITSDEFPIGGMLHGDTIKYACLAAAEYDKNDRARGPMWDRYQQMLQKSIALDRRLHRSERMGVMTDNSDRRPVHPALTRINHVVTVDGTAP